MYISKLKSEIPVYTSKTGVSRDSERRMNTSDNGNFESIKLFYMIL